MLATKFGCPHCRTVLQLSGSIAPGMKFKCPKCAATLTMGAGLKTGPASGAVPKPASTNAFDFTAVTDPLERPARSAGVGSKLMLAAASFGLLLVLGGGIVGAVVLLKKSNTGAEDGLAAGPTTQASPPQTTSKNTNPATTPSTPATPNTGVTPTPKPPVVPPPVTPVPPQRPAQPPAVEEPLPDPLVWIPAEANVVAGIDLGGLFRHPAVGPILVGALKNNQAVADQLQQVERLIGSEVKDLFERVVIGMKVTPPPNREMANQEPPKPELVTVVIQTRIPVELGPIIRAVPGVVEKRFQGKTYFQLPATDPRSPSSTILAVFGRTVILADAADSRLAALLSPPPQPTLAPEAVATIRKLGTNHLWMSFAFDPAIQAELATQVALLQLAPLPAEIKPVLPALAKLKAVSFWLNVPSDQLRVYLGLTCGDESGAKDLTDAVKNLWETQGKLIVTQQLQALPPGTPPIVRSLGKELVDSFKAEQDGLIAQVSLGLKLVTLEASIEQAPQLAAFFLNFNPAAVVMNNPPVPPPPMPSMPPVKPAMPTDLKKYEGPLTKDEQFALDTLNEERKGRKLPMLKAHPKLMAIARAHAEEMAKADRQSYEINGKPLNQVLQEVGYTPTASISNQVGTAEKLTIGQVMENIGVKEKSWTEVGIGIAYTPEQKMYYHVILTSSQ
ncbi:MAG: CAP domain-containing protein [Gemmataceae bacterium]|nr:CAP domain-containing protein [Gemmataceae bacterium]MDW8266614.1 CAP domain-containing protein [Gemmataceae bacterium]